MRIVTFRSKTFSMDQGAMIFTGAVAIASGAITELILNGIRSLKKKKTPREYNIHNHIPVMPWESVKDKNDTPDDPLEK